MRLKTRSKVRTKFGFYTDFFAYICLITTLIVSIKSRNHMHQTVPPVLRVKNNNYRFLIITKKNYKKIMAMKMAALNQGCIKSGLDKPGLDCIQIHVLCQYLMSVHHEADVSNNGLHLALPYFLIGGGHAMVTKHCQYIPRVYPVHYKEKVLMIFLTEQIQYYFFQIRNHLNFEVCTHIPSFSEYTSV